VSTDNAIDTEEEEDRCGSNECRYEKKTDTEKTSKITLLVTAVDSMACSRPSRHGWMIASVGAATCQANAWMHVVGEWGFVLGMKAPLSSSLSMHCID